MKIPEKFELMGRTIEVVYDEDACRDQNNCMGFCSLPDGKIYLRKKQCYDTKKVYPDETIYHTFLHELVHLIFDTMGEEDLSNDEKIVDTFAGLLQQFEKSKSGNLK